MTFTPTVLVDAYISINGNVISDHGNKVTVNVDVEDLDATTFGQTYHVRRGGLKDGKVDISFINDYVGTNLDNIFFNLLGSVVTFQIQPVSGTVTTQNPSYTGSLLVNKWAPISGDIGKLAAVDVSFPTSGTVARNTA